MLRTIVTFAVYGILGYINACLLNYAVALYERAQVEKRRENAIQEIIQRQQESIDEVKRIFS